MSFHGGLLGVVGAAWWWSRRHRLHFFDTMDFVAPLVPPGLGFGRLGNYIGGELWGKHTEAGWGVVFPRAPELRRLDRCEQLRSAVRQRRARSPTRGIPRSCTRPLLEGLVMFCVLWWYLAQAAAALCGVGPVRAAVRLLPFPGRVRARAGRSRLGYLAFGWLTMGQVLSLPLIALGLFWLWLSRRAPTLQPRRSRSRGLKRRAHAAVPRPAAPRARTRHREGRPHRHRHAQRVRLADALRPAPKVSRWSPPRSCTCARSCTSCCGSCRAKPTSPT